MTQTIRRELRQKFLSVLTEYEMPVDYPNIREQLADKLADAALEVRGIALTEKPKSLDWLLASGASAEEIAAINENDNQERELLFFYESKMGYGTTLDWWGKNADLVALRKFLVSKSREDIEAFAKWCKRQFSKFRPEDAVRWPRQVMTFWPLAFEEPTKSAESEYPTLNT